MLPISNAERQGIPIALILSLAFVEAASCRNAQRGRWRIIFDNTLLE
jgi:hypothetical protein